MKNGLKITVCKQKNRLSISTDGRAYSFCVDHDPHNIAWGIARILKPFVSNIEVCYEIPHPRKDELK